MTLLFIGGVLLIGIAVSMASSEESKREREIKELERRKMFRAQVENRYNLYDKKKKVR